MGAKLVVVNGAKPTSIEINRFPATIGRSGEATVRLGTTAVSRKHCELFEKDDDLFIRDLGSRNGTYVNKEKISKPAALETGDLLTIGPVTFQMFCPETQDSVDSYIDLDNEGDATVAESAGMSRVGYRETAAGSFISIEDDVHTPAKQSGDREQKSEGQLNDENAAPKEDSALDAFLKGFE